MKYIISLILCIVCLSSFSQTTNKIKEVKTLNIYGDGKVIIGKIVINQLSKTKIFLSEVKQEKDSLGVYMTKYRFVPEIYDSGFDFNISILFDQPFIEPVHGDFMYSDGAGTMQTTGGHDVEKKYITAKGNTSSNHIYFFVRSYKPLHATIYGVEGTIKK